MTDSRPRKGALMGRIREALKVSPDGMAAFDISIAVNGDKGDVHYSLKKMPDTYIDRWEPTKHKRGPKYVAIWCVVVPPEDCPKPN